MLGVGLHLVVASTTTCRAELAPPLSARGCVRPDKGKPEGSAKLLVALVQIPIAVTAYNSSGSP